MATIDIDTDTGLIRRPMRRVSGAAEFRVRAWVELITIRGEWLTNIESGLDYQAMFDGAEDADIAADVATRLQLIPNFQDLPSLPEITRSINSDDGLYDLAITATVTAFDTPITVSVGTTL